MTFNIRSLNNSIIISKYEFRDISECNIGMDILLIAMAGLHQIWCYAVEDSSLFDGRFSAILTFFPPEYIICPTLLH